jgi:hypothetical protein
MADEPDVDDHVKDWLAAQLGNAINGAIAGPKKPPNLVTVMPLLMVNAFGGDAPNFTQGRPRVDLDIYAATRAGAKAIIKTIHGLMLIECRNVLFEGGDVITGVRDATWPAGRPYDSKNLVHRYGFSCTVLFRPYRGD